MSYLAQLSIFKGTVLQILWTNLDLHLEDGGSNRSQKILF